MKTVVPMALCHMCCVKWCNTLANQDNGKACLFVTCGLLNMLKTNFVLGAVLQNAIAHLALLE